MGRGSSAKRKKSARGKKASPRGGVARSPDRKDRSEMLAAAALDREKIEAAGAGDMEAFRFLYEKYRRRVYALAYKFSFNKEDALDLTQDIFAKLLGAAKEYRGDASVYTWFMRIATNYLIDYVRKKKRRGYQASLDDEKLSEEILVGEHVPTGENPEVAVINAELGEKITEAIAGLDGKHRDVITLFLGQEMSYKDIARTLGISEGTVMSRLYYARKKLQEKLADYLKR